MRVPQVEEMRQRLEEKNRMIEKKTQAAMQAQQERNRMNTELNELKDHMDIKDRKINVLQRKVSLPFSISPEFSRWNCSRKTLRLFSSTFIYFYLYFYLFLSTLSTILAQSCFYTFVFIKSLIARK